MPVKVLPVALPRMPSLLFLKVAGKGFELQAAGTCDKLLKLHIYWKIASKAYSRNSGEVS